MLNLVVADLVEMWMVQMRHVEAWFLLFFYIIRVIHTVYTTARPGTWAPTYDISLVYIVSP